MGNIKVNLNNASAWIDAGALDNYQEKLKESMDAIVNKTGRGHDFLGWVELPQVVDASLLQKIEASAQLMARKSEIFVVTGIGGSYLGARAVIEALKHHFDVLLPGRKNKSPLVLYAGQNLSEDYLADLLDVLDDKDYSLAVISKSGTTTEPAVAFRILKNHLEKKYGVEEAANRIIAITDKEKGALKQLADKLGYQTYVVPDDVGGRYSVLSPVGLLPVAVAGFDIEKLLSGARDMREHLLATPAMEQNPAALYAAARNVLYRSGKKIEVMVNYLPALTYFTEWWKQLYGESEGKEGKGIFPAGVTNTTDLHSMGQYIQEGERIIFETVLSVERVNGRLQIPHDDEDLDRLNYLEGKNLHDVNRVAETATTLAHVDGGVPNIRIEIPELNEYYLGQLIYFFEYACALSGYLLGINPFDQPGVEAYKKNMFALLGKPGFENEKRSLEERFGI
jgi:glucose-6-phosphate isomerase